MKRPEVSEYQLYFDKCIILIPDRNIFWLLNVERWYFIQTSEKMIKKEVM